MSAAHGRGVRELAAALASRLPQEACEAGPEQAPRLAIVGRPNVGKSSLLNALLGEPRALVSEIAGTTRDVVDSLWQKDGRSYLFCDTAGIRHRSKHRTSVEVFSVMRSEKAIQRADLCILVL
ncbi:MAG: 50S ribosome-binding GTPase, partial [Verrucomicrobiae bacterium]|nr:50S ribosome-binding GTPase [Verrucomicrobiae bacterium]